MKKNIILFDGICNLCNSTVQFVIKHDAKNKFQFASLQSEFGQNFLKENALSTSNFDSIIFISEESYYQKSDAALRIAEQLKFPINSLVFLKFIPKKIRDFSYYLIAKNRYKWFGKNETCFIPTKELNQKFLK